MRALITGRHGTVGSALAEHLEAGGWDVVGWDRAAVPIDDYHRMEAFVRDAAPDIVYHLAVASRPTGRPNESWLVNYEWTSELAWITRVLGLRFVFTSTVMVFTPANPGPYTTDHAPDEQHGYGFEKRRAEERVWHQNPLATIARLGWQIGSAAGSNNMIDYLESHQQREGRVRASRRWLPACSMLEDTAAALARLATSDHGLYQLDSNRHWSFHDIAEALNKVHGGRWTIEPHDDFEYDQRMLDVRFEMPSLEERLPLPHDITLR